MIRRHFFASAAQALLIFAVVATARGEDRIRLTVMVNGRPEAFIFDTGFGGTFGMYRSAVERLGLKTIRPPQGVKPQPGEVLLGATEPCAVTMLGRTETVPLQVLETPSGLKPDEAGLVGWPVFSREIVRFHAAQGVENAIIERSLPRDLDGWVKLHVIRRQILTLEIPATDGPPVRVNVDTGAPSGVALQPDLFRAWRKANPGGPSTLEAYWLPASGLLVREEVWADELSLGLMRLHNVPVDEGAASEIAGALNLTAVIGMAALRHLDLVVDGPNDTAYVRPGHTSLVPYTHNRIGAVFVPHDLRSTDLVATVLPRGPAGLAGVKPGDVLLKINALDVTAWQTKPGIMPLTRFWTQPPGTSVTLTLRRNKKNVVIPVTLQEILGPRIVETP